MNCDGRRWLLTANWIGVAAAVSVIVLLAIGCDRSHRGATTQASKKTKQQVRDASSKPTSGQSKRLISLSPAITEVLFAVGCGDQLVARDGWSDFPAEATAVMALKGLVPSAEAVIGLQPDLVLSHFPPTRLTSSLDLVGIQWRGFTPRRLSEIGKSFVKIGAMCGRVGAGQKLQAILDASVQRARRRRPSKTVRVYVELDPGQGRPHTVGKGSFIQDMIESAGGEGLFADRGPWLQVSAEEVISRTPDLVILTSKQPALERRKFAARPGWQGCEACTINRIKVINPDLLTRPGPRLHEAITLLSEWVNATAAAH